MKKKTLFKYKVLYCILSCLLTLSIITLGSKARSAEIMVEAFDSPASSIQKLEKTSDPQGQPFEIILSKTVVFDLRLSRALHRASYGVPSNCAVLMLFFSLFCFTWIKNKETKHSIKKQAEQVVAPDA